MQFPDHLYPAKPTSLNFVPGEATPELQQAIRSVMLSIVFFIICYLLLLAVVVAGAILLGYLGILIMSLSRHLLMLAIGVGMIAIGVTTFIFLIKFLFVDDKSEADREIEIFESDEPVLFEFIRRVSAETNTPFPGKIVLIPDVNASVFYRTSFISLLFPGKKNLRIGLGLVNALNISEFKAVLAHEFGHFSQRTTKYGAYTYRLNQVIYKTVFNNEGFDDMFRGIASIGAVGVVFVHIVAGTMRGLIVILRKLYEVINKSYLVLSRQMEYQADSISAGVCGSNHMAGALFKLQFAAVSYDSMLERNESFRRKNFRSRNIYLNHTTVMEQWLHAIGFETIDEIAHDKHKRSKLVVKQNLTFNDQWSTHPTLEEREENLNKNQVITETISAPAWSLFTNTEAIQEQFTGLVYETVEFNAEATLITGETFAEMLSHEKEKYSYPTIFNDYYSNRSISLFDVEAAENVVPVKRSRSELLKVIHSEKAQIPQEVLIHEQDLALSGAITRKEIDTKTFDYKGTKYPVQKSIDIGSEIEGKLNDLRKELLETDQEIYSTFYSHSLATGQEGLHDVISAYFSRCEDNRKIIGLLESIMTVFSPIFSGEPLNYEQVAGIVAIYKMKFESDFKNVLKEMLDTKLVTGLPDPLMLANFNKYLEADIAFYGRENVNSDELKLLHACVLDLYVIHQDLEFIHLSAYLKCQEKIYLETEEESMETLSA